MRNRYEPDEPSTRRVGLTETMNAIEEGQHLCEANGIQVLVLFIPTMAHALAPNISFDRAEDQAEYLPERQPGVQDFGDAMRECCARVGCAFINMLDPLRQAEANGNRTLYIPNDEHLDVGGHDVVARTIVSWISKS